MAKTEITFGRWKVKRIDSLNWQVFEWREIKESSKTKRGGETDWMAHPAYFSKLENALEWVYDKETEDMGIKKSLKTAVAQMRTIKTQLMADIRDALAEGAE